MPDVFLGTDLVSGNAGDRAKERTRSIVDAALADLDASSRATAIDLLMALFPRLNGVYRNMSYGSEWERTWAEEQRVAAAQYFSRYFSYAIPEGDIPDTVIQNLVSSAAQVTAEVLEREVRALLTKQNADALISKLRRREAEVPEEAISTLVLTLASLGDIIPDPPAPFDHMNPRPQAAMHIGSLVRKLPSRGDRVELGKQVLRKASPIPFAVDCLRWFRWADKSRPDPLAFIDEEKAELGLTLARRIAIEAASDPLLLSLGKDAPNVLYVWLAHGAPNEARDHIRTSLAEDPALILPLLRSFVPTAWGMESGLPSESDFERSQYDAVANLVDPKAVVAALRAHFGTIDVPVEFPYAEDASDPRDLTTARQFLWIHERLLEEEEIKQDAADEETTED